VLPEGVIELTREEMSYVEGGIALRGDGLYFDYYDIMGIVVAVGTNAYSVAAGLTAMSSWLCASGVGSIIWSLFAISSVRIALMAISAISQGKGLLLSLQWTKIWFVNVPCGLNLQVK
jgi:hypothetical protein